MKTTLTFLLGVLIGFASHQPSAPQAGQTISPAQQAYLQELKASRDQQEGQFLLQQSQRLLDRDSQQPLPVTIQ